MQILCRSFVYFFLLATPAVTAQQPPYHVYPDAEPPYYRVRYQASSQPGDLSYAVNYTVWIPENVRPLRGIIVHQHGCGEGSCASGLTGAYDLHWQALAKKHQCALLSPSYEQPEHADCQMWCDPRNGSAAAFDRALRDLGEMSGHTEIATAPLALWGHSGGGHWCGGMVMTQPERIIAAWLRSGVPVLEADSKETASTSIRPHALPNAALRVPMICNLGTKEGVTVKDGQFDSVWPANLAFFEKVRGSGGLLGIAIDPLTAHECGNSRYLAIPWLDRCLELRLPVEPGEALLAISSDSSWLAESEGTVALPASDFDGDPLAMSWLPTEDIATAWMQYRQDANVQDSSEPPAPTHVQREGSHLNWRADADLESGIAKFIVLRDGKFLADVSGTGKNPFGRPLFQNLQYSDTPVLPLAKMEFTDAAAGEQVHDYEIITVNTVGLKSTPTPAVERSK